MRQIIGTVLSRGGSTVLNFLIALLLARHAGPQVKGEVTLLVTITFFFIFISNILGGQALIYLLPRHRAEILLFPAYLWSAVVTLCGFAFLKFSGTVRVAHIPTITAISFFSSIISVHQSYLFASGRLARANLLTVIPLVLQLTCLLAFFYWLQLDDVYAYIYAALFSQLLTSAMSCYMVWPEISWKIFRRQFNSSDFFRSLKSGLYFQSVEILQLLLLRYYFFPLGLQQGFRYLGIYSVGISILEAVWIIPRAVSTVQYIRISKAPSGVSQSDPMLRAAIQSVALAAIAVLLIMLVPANVFSSVFGTGFQDVKHAIRFLAPGIVVYSAWIAGSGFYFGRADYQPLLVSSFSGFVVLTAAGHFLIPHYVMSGAGLAASLGLITSSLVLFFIYRSANPTKVADIFSTARNAFLFHKQ